MDKIFFLEFTEFIKLKTMWICSF